MFLADPQQPAAQVGGSQMTYDGIVVHGRGSTNIVRTQGNHRWASLSLSHDDLAAAGEAIAGREVTCPSDTRLVMPPPEIFAELRALHAQTIAIATTMPGTLTAPTVAKTLEQRITHALVKALVVGTPSERRWLPGQHARIVNRFLEFLEARPDEPVYLAEICTAIGASERTLRTCCQEVLGAGPLRYLWMRRMHLARRALMHADASMTTVTEIATAHGFWELGRFSVEYRTLFGESPSQSLRRAGTKADFGPRAAHVRMG
jgi:AraC-like DNA-binding protein